MEELTIKFKKCYKGILFLTILYTVFAICLMAHSIISLVLYMVNTEDIKAVEIVFDTIGMVFSMLGVGLSILFIIYASISLSKKEPIKYYQKRDIKLRLQIIALFIYAVFYMLFMAVTFIGLIDNFNVEDLIFGILSLPLMALSIIYMKKLKDISNEIFEYKIEEPTQEIKTTIDK